MARNRTARVFRALALVLLVLAVVALAVLVARRLMADSGATARGGATPAAVEVGPIRIGSIEERRVFSGTLEARARVSIAPKVAGTVVSLPVDLGDVITRGQVIARIDAAEFEQAVAQAEAELEVARASLTEAQNGAEIAQREFERITILHERGVASDSQLDVARASRLAADSSEAVTRAQVARAEAAAQSARIRLGYTVIEASWDNGAEHRVVASRHAEAGDTIGANTPILTIVELDPIRAIFFATERDYSRIGIGQPVTIRTDAAPNRTFDGSVSRIAPVFDAGSRQARIEVTAPNSRLDLKPGMFARIEVILDNADNATIIPYDALTRRDGQDVVFLVVTSQSADDGKEVSAALSHTVRMLPVTTGLRNGPIIQVDSEELRANSNARVVTVGQQLLTDGSPILIPGDTQPMPIESRNDGGTR